MLPTSEKKGKKSSGADPCPLQMELATATLSVVPFSKARPRAHIASNGAFSSSLIDNMKLQKLSRKVIELPSALPETDASVMIAVTVVGAAATLLLRRTKASEKSEIGEVPLKLCIDCNGSGICSECNGEGFVLKKISEEGAEKARMSAKNMATRYTAGLPKKWSYCTKCSSGRSCSTCGGRGKLEL